jgi:hypothetical protein
MLYAEPGPEDRDAVAAVWLAQLAARYPGRHFRLLTEQERLKARETGADTDTNHGRATLDTPPARPRPLGGPDDQH